MYLFLALIFVRLVYGEVSCSGHSDGSLFIPDETVCSDVYYQCVGGIAMESPCAAGLFFNPSVGYCDWKENNDACKGIDPTPPSDGSTGNAVSCSGHEDGSAFIPDETVCSDVYYQCVGGNAIESHCSSGLFFNPSVGSCDWKDVACTETITDKPSATTTASGGTITDKPIATTPASGVITQTMPDRTTTETTSKVPQNNGKTYVGFVVDDTGSMSNEIIAVKDWISECVSGVIAGCGEGPTGGWIITSFNDPYVGSVVGPTLDTDRILDAADGYYAHGCGDCPEMAFTGLQSAVDAVPRDNGGCKMYFFSDATGQDYDQKNSVSRSYQEKGCSFVPILTGCCGTCPPVSETVDSLYYSSHVSESTRSSTGTEKSTGVDVQTLFYEMSEETGGNIYVTDKPSSPDEMLDFLEEEVTLGFCGSTEIAGPQPEGYKCEADCNAMKMCWDKSVSTCYCNGTCARDPIPTGYSRCAGTRIVQCNKDLAEQIIPDQRDCAGYFQCNSGTLNHFTCASGSLYSSVSTSHCDHPENVPPPCGTQGIVEISP